jgi:hypothetical protein
LSGNDVLVRYRASCPSAWEMGAALEKSDLLKQALGKNIRFVVT